MASQPANATISVFRSVRSYRMALRHESVAALIKRLRPLIMSVPGEEVLVGALTRDTTLQDFSPYCGQARQNPSGATAATAIRGFPIVVGLHNIKTFADAQGNAAGTSGLPSIDFAFQIGSDKFLTNISRAEASAHDLHADLRSDTLVAERVPTDWD